MENSKIIRSAKKKQDWIKREIGRGADGEWSVRELFKWLKLASVTLMVSVTLVGMLAFASSVRDKKEAAVLEVDAGAIQEFYLNRKGAILRGKDDAAEVQKDYTLEDGVSMILQSVLERGYLENGRAVILSLRPSENGIVTDLERFAEEIHVYAEAFLRKKNSNGTVYVKVLDGEDEVGEYAAKYHVSLGRAALAEDLIRENVMLTEWNRERLIQMPMDQLLTEISVRKYDTSFHVVVAKKVYAIMIEEIEKGSGQDKENSEIESTAEVQEELPTESAVTEAATKMPETTVQEAPEETTDTIEEGSTESEEGESESTLESENGEEENSPESEDGEGESASESEDDDTESSAQTENGGAEIKETEAENAESESFEEPDGMEDEAGESESEIEVGAEIEMQESEAESSEMTDAVNGPTADETLRAPEPEANQPFGPGMQMQQNQSSIGPAIGQMVEQVIQIEPGN